jgi:hypothetical protein
MVVVYTQRHSVVSMQMKCLRWVGCCYCFLLSAYFCVPLQPSLAYVSDPDCLLLADIYTTNIYLSRQQRDAQQLEGSERANSSWASCCISSISCVIILI